MASVRVGVVRVDRATVGPLGVSGSISGRGFRAVHTASQPRLRVHTYDHARKLDGPEEKDRRGR